MTLRLTGKQYQVWEVTQVASPDINICCPYFCLLGCGDTDEHQHIVCEGKSGIDDNPAIDNEWAKVHCLSDPFSLCPYFPRSG